MNQAELNFLAPERLSAIEQWCKDQRALRVEGEKRYIHAVVLRLIARHPHLCRMLVFKGGNALRLLHHSRRTTEDIDFSATQDFPSQASEIRRLFTEAISVHDPFEVKLKVQRVDRNPVDREGQKPKTHPTFEISVGYMLATQTRFKTYPENRPYNDTVLLEVATNDEISEAVQMKIGNSFLMFCSLEDIIAEKLRALLQQKQHLRNRRRKQDVYDIARLLLRDEEWLDLDKVSRFFKAKCLRRDVPVAKNEFDEEVFRRASVEYDTLFDFGDPEAIPFEQAKQLVLDLVSKLDIPAISQ